MSDKYWYTITGHRTGVEYLVVIERGYRRLFQPSQFRLPWTGDSGVEYGLTYQPLSGKQLRGRWAWVNDLHARALVAGYEEEIHRIARHQDRLDRFVEKKRRG